MHTYLISYQIPSRGIVGHVVMKFGVPLTGQDMDTVCKQIAESAGDLASRVVLGAISPLAPDRA